jgi:asparagine synthase (glutamine-hydrolysing)
MCGIAGFYSFHGAPADRNTLKNMLALQRHRGPDDHGMRLFCLNEGRSAAVGNGSSQHDASTFPGALGFNRLSILDLSHQGHQPMANSDQTIFLAFNGEIYNAFDYVKELRSHGFVFRSQTDTEVVLYLYEQYGFAGMLERLNGMFSIVIVDLKRREINIARDHFGIKPFYWCQVGHVLLFASEVKSFLAHPAFHPEIDTAKLDEYLTFRYCSGDRHLLKGVQQLRPGHWLRIGEDGITIRRYWEIPDNNDKADLPEREAIDKFDCLLRKSVQRQLLADVKIGCQLSGGTDSSIVSLLARSHFNADMDTFSIIFDDPAYSEERWISRAAIAANASSHRYILTSDAFVSALSAATWHLDQPLNHPNSIGIYLLAKNARSLVTVLLSGEGADELMGGYGRYFDALLKPALQPFTPILQRLPFCGRDVRRKFGIANDIESFITASAYANPLDLKKVKPNFDVREVLELRREIFNEGHSDPLSNYLKFDMQTYMVDLLVRQDKMTMAHSLENRVPFLDLELVDFVRSLPADYLVKAASPALYFSERSKNTKIILKKLAERTFGKDFVYRPKEGFGLPLASFFATEKFGQIMNDRLIPGMIKRGLFCEEAIKTHWSNARLQKSVPETLWILIAFEMWAETFVDNRSQYIQ